jgi:hypothetical protein
MIVCVCTGASPCAKILAPVGGVDLQKNGMLTVNAKLEMVLAIRSRPLRRSSSSTSEATWSMTRFQVEKTVNIIYNIKLQLLR